ncbi:dipeptidase [bacterium]|jgi:acetylornithine deacetylase/succinyl-diaminopimelate desuccinylase-like protein|nr:dipeptidase [bacterium]MDC0258864.1 dipeptidase [Verrucomicrobiales bacterium]MDC0314680.1 dipeptidase [bacterium]MDC0322824.1 dipeptidase [Verrucomicrobiales bacterium]
MSQKQLDEFFDYLRFPSISTDSNHKSDVNACADSLVAKFTSMGLSVEKHETPGHPVIVAKSESKDGLLTVLIYGHYDVQPVDPVEEWDTPPFEPTLVGDKIFCRGATDNKGQNFAHILGVEETLKEEGELPVNVIFLLEGEEEIGSPNLAPFLREHKDELKCDICAVSDTGMIGPGIPTMTYGLRGIACLEFIVRGPTLDLHSGVYGGAVPNPALIAAQIVSKLHDENGKILIPGFYDKVVPLEDWEREMWAKLPDGEQATIDETGVKGLWGEAGYTALEQRWGRPTAEVNGIGGGYQGEGSKTVIPREAMAKLSFRLVADQDPADILKLASDYLNSLCPDSCTIEVELGHDGPAYVMDPNSKYGKAAQTALKETFNDAARLIREGGSIPIIQAFKDILDVDTLLLGLALPDCQIHAPNESFTVTNFEAGIKLNRALLKELAK